MEFRMRRIIIYTANFDAMTRFYRDILRLKVAGMEKGWIDFDAGTCNIALHSGRSEPGRRPPRLSFYAKDVSAARDYLLKAGVKMGKLQSTPHFDMCVGKHPDGNPIGISGRV